MQDRLPPVNVATLHPLLTPVVVATSDTLDDVR